MFDVFAFLNTHLGKIEIPALIFPLLLFWVNTLAHFKERANAKNGLFCW